MCKVCLFLRRLSHAVSIYILNILLWIDEGANVVFLPILRMFRIIPKDPALGNAHYTVSQWTAYAADGGSRFAKSFCWVLTKVFNLWVRKKNYDHCYDATHYADGTLIPPDETAG